MTRKRGGRGNAAHTPTAYSDVWQLLTELLGGDPAALGVSRKPVQTFRAYVFAGPEPVPRSDYVPRVFGVYDGIPYFRPDGWWQLRVEPFCAHGYNRARSDFDEIKDWPIAYHGTSCDFLASILESGLRKPQELEKVMQRHGGCNAGPNGSIYLSPSLWYASHPVYSTIKRVREELWAQVVLKLRVRPGSYRAQRSTLFEKHWSPALSFDPNLPGSASMEWLLDGSSAKRTDCVIVGLMIRQIGGASLRHIFGHCPRLSVQGPSSSTERAKKAAPEFQWTKHLEHQFRLGGYVRDEERARAQKLDVPYVHMCDDDGDGQNGATTGATPDGVLRDERDVSTAEAASRSAEQLEAPGVARVIEELLARYGACLLSGRWTAPPRMEKDLSEKVRQSLTRHEPVRDSNDARSRYVTLLGQICAHADGGKPLDAGTLLAWHGLCMKGIHPACGQLRNRAVRCGEYPYMDHPRLPQAVEEYAKEATRVAVREDLSGPTKAAWCHYHLVRIHPFADGNGRMGRLMAVWALARHGLPWKLCLVPLFHEGSTGCRMDVSRKAYIEAHLIAARHRGAQSADIRPFAVHVCKCILVALHVCGVLPPGVDIDALEEVLRAAEDAAVASSARPTADFVKPPAMRPALPGEYRLTRKQRRVLECFAEKVSDFDPSVSPEKDWSPPVQEIPARRLRSSHGCVSATFGHGPHAGESVYDLTGLLRSGYSPSNLPPLLAVWWRGEYWVIAGNRRLRALSDFSPDATARVVVHELSGDTPAPLFAKFLLAMTTETGGALPPYREDDEVSESVGSSSTMETADDSDTSTSG